MKERLDITNWTSKEFIKHLVAHRAIKQGEFGLEVFKETGQDYQAKTFSSKIVHNNLKLKEVQAACKILGYRLVLEEIENK